jgi:hypothetical protein
MSSVPDGRAANQPFFVQTLTPPMGASLPGARQHLLDPLAGEFRLRTCERSSLESFFFCSGVAAARRDRRNGSPRSRTSARYASAGIAAGARRDLGREQRGRDAVLVGAPGAAVESAERSARAFLAAEAQAPDSRPATNHLKPTGTSYSAAPSRAATRSIMALLTMVLPTPAAWPSTRRCRNK